MIQLTVPTTFTDSFLDKIDVLNNGQQATGNCVFELYGSLQYGMFNSARPAKYLPGISKKTFRRHVQEAKQRGLRFNYLFNAPGYSNQEYTHAGRKALNDILTFLVDSGVNSVTVTVPYLAEIINLTFPELEVVISTIGYVDSMRGLEQFKRAGAERVVLDVEVNRDFTFLRKAVTQSPVPIELIVNTVCIYQCHYKHNHYSVAGFGSHDNPDNPGGSPYNQFYLNWCFLEKLSREGEFLKSPWLRPEDMGLWEVIGITYYKLAGRGLPEDEIIRLCRAYLSKTFSGNLLDLMGWPHWQQFNKCTDGTILPELDIILDNSKLNGFLDFFASNTRDCRLGCDGCNHCLKWSRKVLNWRDASLRKKYIENMQQNIQHLITHIPTQEETEQTGQNWQQQIARQDMAK
jgi:collagenase-like PrtC family protease